VQTEFRPLWGPADWQSCERNIFGTSGDDGVDVVYRRPCGALLRVQLHRDSTSSPSRFFRETAREWQAQERTLDAVPVASRGWADVDGSSRPLNVTVFASGLWAALTDDGAPITVALVGEDWPLDDLVLVQVPADAFAMDHEDEDLLGQDEEDPAGTGEPPQGFPVRPRLFSDGP
jgi:hypothetical protein